MTKFLVNIRYFLTPSLILLTLFGLLKGGNWVYLGLAMFLSLIHISEPTRPY